MSHRRRRVAACSVGFLLAVAGLKSAAAEHPSLVWYAEADDGRAVAERGADLPINPASVVKVATTWSALSTLGAERRFDTRFAASGKLDPTTGVLDGDLIVLGGGDPDFHVENAYLVARELNRIGLREVRGDLLVEGPFWIGWEGGSGRRLKDPRRRGAEMASRLRRALDPALRHATTLAGLRELAARRGWPFDPAVGVAVRGRATSGAAAPAQALLLIHRSNPLRLTLKRFNGYSNNDIERLTEQLGPAPQLARRLAEARGEEAQAPPRLETLSGLGVNRLTPRQIVHLLRLLRETCAAAGLRVEDLLPVGGCDPGTLTHLPSLTEGANAGAVVAKTGTLTTTDGGVAVLAGIAGTAAGEVFFAVASPGAGQRLVAARREQEEWLLGLVQRQGGAVRRPCGAAVGFSDDDVLLLVPPPSPAAGAPSPE